MNREIRPILWDEINTNGKSYPNEDPAACQRIRVLPFESTFEDGKPEDLKCPTLPIDICRAYIFSDREYSAMYSMVCRAWAQEIDFGPNGSELIQYYKTICCLGDTRAMRRYINPKITGDSDFYQSLHRAIRKKHYHFSRLVASAVGVLDIWWRLIAQWNPSLIPNLDKFIEKQKDGVFGSIAITN